MMPMQSIEAQPSQLGPGMSATSPVSPTAGENGERQQKPKTLPCKYCSKRFRRVEHVQRHERTHTKEKPFACGWARCGKTFGRRDLLVRHEKLVHLNEGGANKDGNRPRKSSGAASQQLPASATAGTAASPTAHSHELLGAQRPPAPGLQTPRHQPHPHPHSGSLQPSHQAHQVQQGYHQDPIPGAGAPALAQDPRLHQARASACNLDLLSDAALASEVNHPTMPDMGQGQPQSGHARMKSYEEQMGGYPDRAHDFAASSHMIAPPFDPDQQMGGMWPRQPGDPHQGPRGMSKPASRFPSRFPSMQPEGRDATEGPTRLGDDAMRAPCSRITATDHGIIKSRLEEFSSVLPNDFVFPSRHTLTRFLEGYTTGFHDYLPFLHLPTLVPADIAPELLLAILAVGAQYRFESHRGYALWYAAKAVALEQIRRRHSHEVHALLPTPAAYSPHSTRPSPSAGFRHSFAAAQQERPLTQETHREPFSPNTPQARLETIQAVLLLFAVGLWGASAILHEALSLQSQLALLVREEGLTAESSPGAAPDWETWIRLEGSTRTKLMAYCFFNLCSVAYNTPPLLFTSELNLFMPYPARQWRADTVWQWQEARQTYPTADITLHDAFSRVFNRAPQGPALQMSSLGHYVLIHAVTQHIYLLKQTCFAQGSPFELQKTLRQEDVEEVTQALRTWQSSFEQRQQVRVSEAGPNHNGGGGNGDSFSGGPMALNASALFRLAYIRLNTDIPPGRCLETRDSMLVASCLSNTPLLLRSVRVQRAVFQAIHALSMLVRAGVNYVARTKSTEWSIQHSLCNFECVILLSKWLLTLSAIGPNEPPVSGDEKNLLEMVRRMLDETEFAVPIDPSLGGPTAGQPPSMEAIAGDSARLRQLAAAVIRLWAETFKGSHIFDLVKVMGFGLDTYANLVEKPRDRTPLGRMAPETGMG